jgi:hypothetical protein
LDQLYIALQYAMIYPKNAQIRTIIARIAAIKATKQLICRAPGSIT